MRNPFTNSVRRVINALAPTMSWHARPRRPVERLQQSVPALGVDGQVARLRSIMAEARASLETFDATRDAARQQLAAADYALMHVRRMCGGLLPTQLTIIGTPIPAYASVGSGSRRMSGSIAA